MLTSFVTKSYYKSCSYVVDAPVDDLYRRRAGQLLLCMCGSKSLLVPQVPCHLERRVRSSSLKSMSCLLLV